MFIETQPQWAKQLFVGGAVALLLTACGGGGGGGGPVTPPNNPPTANAGPDQSTIETATVTMAGSGSDSDGGTLSYAWSQVSGPTVSFASTTDPATDVELPFVPIGTAADVVLRLTVNDGQGGSASDEVTITAASNDYVVFQAAKDTSGVFELYLYDTQLDEVRKLNGPMIADGDVSDFKISPDGQRIAYRADQDADDVAELYVAMADGSGFTKVNAAFANASADVFAYEWSPDSAQIVYTADADIDGATEVFLADADGGNHAKINGTIGSGPSVYLSNPKWSPDGRYIAQVVRDFGTNRRLAINTFDTQLGQPNSVRVATMPAAGAIVPGIAWSPDSAVITYIADQDTDGVNELYGGMPDGSGTTRLSSTLVAGGLVRSFEWAPDGSAISYLADQDVAGQTELYVSQPDGSGNVRVSRSLSAGATLTSSEWAPDSSRIAYLFTDSGSTELAAVLPDGTGDATINGTLVAGGSVSSFRWSPDSTRIAYDAWQDDAAVIEIYASNADGTMNEKLSDPMVAGARTYFASPEQYALWSPDSAMFTYPADSVTAGTIENWVHDFSGGADAMVTRTPVTNGALQTWAMFSADSSALIYISQQDDPQLSELYLASPDGATNRSISGPIVAGGQFFLNFRWFP